MTVDPRPLDQINAQSDRLFAPDEAEKARLELEAHQAAEGKHRAKNEPPPEAVKALHAKIMQGRPAVPKYKSDPPPCFDPIVAGDTDTAPAPKPPEKGKRTRNSGTLQVCAVDGDNGTMTVLNHPLFDTVLEAQKWLAGHAEAEVRYSIIRLMWSKQAQPQSSFKFV